MSEEKSVVYLVRCSDNSLYCGISNDFERRLIEHNSGKGAKYTKSRGPVDLVGISPEMTKSEALKLEYRIKLTAADKKIVELKETGLQISIKWDLQALVKEIRALGKKVERIAKRRTGNWDSHPQDGVGHMEMYDFPVSSIFCDIHYFLKKSKGVKEYRNEHPEYIQYISERYL